MEIHILKKGLLLAPYLLPGAHTTWSSSGYTPARLPSLSLLITTWQRVKAHGVTRNEPKILFTSHTITVRWLRESHYAFVIRFWFNVLYLELYLGIFLLFHIQMEPFSVTSMMRLMHLFLLHPLITIWPRNWYRIFLLPFSRLSKSLYTSFSAVLISSFTGFKLVAMFHPAFLWHWYDDFKVRP